MSRVDFLIFNYPSKTCTRTCDDAFKDGGEDLVARIKVLRRISFLAKRAALDLQDNNNPDSSTGSCDALHSLIFDGVFGFNVCHLEDDSRMNITLEELQLTMRLSSVQDFSRSA